MSKQLLLPIFSKVDLVEQNGSFLEQAPEYLVCHDTVVVPCKELCHSVAIFSAYMYSIN